MHHSFIKPLIEDAVQVWHFYVILKKYGKAVREVPEIREAFIERVNLIIGSIADPAEIPRFKEFLEELDEDHIPEPPTKPVKSRPEPVRRSIPEKVASMDNSESASIKKPYTIIRELYSLIVELDVKYKKLDERVQSLEESMASATHHQ